MQRVWLQLLRVSARLVFFFSAACFAQAPDGDKQEVKYGSEMSFHLGTLLPNQIDGVTEILPMAGLRFGLPTKGGLVELGAANAHAYGTDYDIFSASFRADFIPLEQFVTFIYAGPDFHYYSPPGQDYTTAWGGHVGSGLMMHISDTMWFRGDMKFNMNPGTALYIGFGLIFRSKASGEAE